LSTFAAPATARFSAVIHRIHIFGWGSGTALASFVDFIEKLTVYYMVGLPEKGRFLEAHVSAKYQKKKESPRLPHPHEHQGRSPCHQTQARQRQEETISIGSSTAPVDKKHRLTRSADFQRVYRQGKSVAGRHAVLYYFERVTENGEGGPRLGVSVSRKVGGAVVRNQVKRVLKEVFRELQERTASEYDYVIIARKGLPDFIEKSRHEEVVNMVTELFQRANLIQETD